MKRFYFLTIAALAPLIYSPSGYGFEFYLDGYFRVRGRVFDTLSLDRESQYSEGTRNYFETSFKMNPILRVNERVSLHSRIDLLDLTIWGKHPLTYSSSDPLTEWEPFSQSIEGGDDYSKVIDVKRLWGEILTDAGMLKIGRMPDHWGLGLYANDGNDINSDYGDSVDRALFSSRLGPVYTSFGYEINGEGALNSTLDDTQSALLIVAYRGELNSIGLYGKYRNNPEYTLNLWVADLWGKSTIGPMRFELEALYLAGEGTIDEEEAIIAQYGGVLKMGTEFRDFGIGFEIGLASGDEDPTNSTYAGYSFDRDYRPALIIFRQDMPVFKSKEETDEVDDSFKVTGEGISNIVYILPAIEYFFLKDLSAKASLFTGWTLKTNTELNNEKEYGEELDIDIKWKVSRVVELGITNAFFWPGTVYGDYQDFCYGLELRSIVNF